MYKYMVTITGFKKEVVDDCFEVEATNECDAEVAAIDEFESQYGSYFDTVDIERVERIND